MNTQHFAVYIIAIFAIITLTSAKPLKTNHKEAIVIGQILIDSQTKLDPKGITIRFSNDEKDGKSSKATADGFFCCKLDVENSFINYIEYKKDGKFRKIFKDNCATLHLPEGQKIYYIGDIQLEWTPSEKDRIRKAFSVSVGVGAVHSDDGGDISVQSSYKPEEECHNIKISNSLDAINWYKKKFPEEERKIETKLINIL